MDVTIPNVDAPAGVVPQPIEPTPEEPKVLTEDSEMAPVEATAEPAASEPEVAAVAPVVADLFPVTDVPTNPPKRGNYQRPVQPELTPEEQETKKRKADQADAESKKRGKRMFGLLQGTLNQAREQTGRLSGTTKNRQEVEERLSAKLAKEREVMEAKRLKGKAAKDLAHEINLKEHEIKVYDTTVSSARRAYFRSAALTSLSQIPVFPPTLSQA